MYVCMFEKLLNKRKQSDYIAQIYFLQYSFTGDFENFLQRRILYVCLKLSDKRENKIIMLYGSISCNIHSLQAALKNL